MVGRLPSKVKAPTPSPAHYPPPAVIFCRNASAFAVVCTPIALFMSPGAQRCLRVHREEGALWLAYRRKTVRVIDNLNAYTVRMGLFFTFLKKNTVKRLNVTDKAAEKKKKGNV